MNMVLDATPVPFVNPFSNTFDVMPLAMAQAYVPYAPYLRLEEAAKVAWIRDFENAATLLRDLNGGIDPTIPEGCSNDELSVEPPTLR